MNLKLNLIIKDPDLRILKASNLRVTLAKPVGDGMPNVAWLVFDPFMGNTVEWTEEYGLYASTVSLKQGTKISRISELPPPVKVGKTYLFGNDANPVFDFDDASIEPVPAGSFRIENLLSGDDYPTLAFGLTQKAVINNKSISPSCINAATVPSQMNVTFTPLTTVYVWLQNLYASGTVITNVMSKTTKVLFGGPVTENSLEYDSEQGCFVAAPNGKAEYVHIRTPALVY
jgi:hypothetical protein